MTLGRLSSLPILALVITSAAVYACSAVGNGSQFGQGGAGGSAADGLGGGLGPSANSSGDGLFDAGPGAGSGSGGPGCAVEATYVYTLDATKNLYKFDPPTLAFTLIGTLNCMPKSPFDTPYSMSVSRDATAWVVYTSGELFQVDTKTANCKSTAYVPGQSGFTTFGMGFSTNAPGSVDETLYVSDAQGFGGTKGLAKIDLTTLTLTPIGMYDKLNARAEMTGTGDARLFGAFEGTPYNVAEISKTDAKILSQAPQTAINYAPGSSNFAFAFWGGDFYLFVGPGTSTDVFHYVPATKVTTKVKTVNFEIVGAGVSTCAPTKPPS